MARSRTVKEQLGVDLDEQPEDQQLQVTPEAEAEQQPPEAEERPDWLPEQYKDPEAFAAAHKSLQNELRLRGEREKEMSEQLDQLTAWAQQAQQQPQYQSNDPLDAYAQEIEIARENGDARREAELQAWLVQYNIGQAMGQQNQAWQQQQAPLMAANDEIFAQAAQEAMARKYEDWGEVAPKVAEFLSDPNFVSDRSYSSLAETLKTLDRAYTLSKAEQWREQVEQMQQAGLTQADLDRARKLQAQTMSGSSGRPDQPSPADAQLAEMRGALHGSSYEFLRGKAS